MLTMISTPQTGRTMTTSKNPQQPKMSHSTKQNPPVKNTLEIQKSRRSIPPTTPSETSNVFGVTLSSKVISPSRIIARLASVKFAVKLLDVENCSQTRASTILTSQSVTEWKKSLDISAWYAISIFKRHNRNLRSTVRSASRRISLRSRESSAEYASRLSTVSKLSLLTKFSTDRTTKVWHK